ncbi:MAG: invasion associated locus B family protein [Rhodobacteraceae bacterium]|jgi:invasion protein IalB|nr:invasion associated locus B family protein [Paracoccaceae bacterium]
MSIFRIAMTLALATLLVSAPARAQQAPAEGQPAAEDGATEQAPAADGAASDAGGLSMGEPVASDGGEIGTPYVKEEHGSWQIRCIRTPSGVDPCQLYQLLRDDEGNPVSEFSLFPLTPPQGDAVAGGNIITPLETLLTQAVTMQIDTGEPRRYPFTFCTTAGCFARIGYSAADIDRFKRGRSATVSIVPLVAPDQRISLSVSLTGFTAGYDALSALIAEQAAAAQAEGADAGEGEGEGAATGDGN